ncbi:hypothetical protein [Persephonella sp.]
MRKSLLLLLIITNIAFGFKYTGDKKTEVKIIERICMTLLDKQYVNVFVSNDISYILKYSNRFISTNSCKQADIIISNKALNIKECSDKPIFVIKYYLLKKYPNAIGALYWHKGRPNIVLIKERLEMFNLFPSPELIQFIESEQNLW